MTSFTTEDRLNAVRAKEVGHLREFIEFGKMNFEQGSMLFGSAFLQDAIEIAEELLAIKEKQPLIEVAK